MTIIGHPPSEADRAISWERVGVEQDSRLCLQGVLHVHHGLVLQARVLREVVLVPLLVRTAILFIVPQVSQFLLDHLPLLMISFEARNNYEIFPALPDKSWCKAGTQHFAAWQTLQFHCCQGPPSICRGLPPRQHEDEIQFLMLPNLGAMVVVNGSLVSSGLGIHKCCAISHDLQQRSRFRPHTMPYSMHTCNKYQLRPHRISLIMASWFQLIWLKSPPRRNTRSWKEWG